MKYLIKILQRKIRYYENFITEFLIKDRVMYHYDGSTNNNITIVHPGHIGDLFIMARAVGRWEKIYQPQKITLIVSNGMSPAAKLTNLFDEVLEVSYINNYFTLFAHSIALLMRTIPRESDVLYQIIKDTNLLVLPYSFWPSLNMLACFNLNLKVLKQKYFQNYQLHRSQVLTNVTPEIQNYESVFGLSSEFKVNNSVDITLFNQLIAGKIIIQVGSRDIKKCFNAEFWIKFINTKINIENGEIYFIGAGIDDERLINEIIPYLNHLHVKNLCNKTQLKDIQDTLLDCDCAVSVDSFLQHLAAYHDKPHFVIFKADRKDISRWSSQHEKGFYVRAHN